MSIKRVCSRVNGRPSLDAAFDRAYFACKLTLNLFKKHSNKDNVDMLKWAIPMIYSNQPVHPASMGGLADIQ